VRVADEPHAGEVSDRLARPLPGDGAAHGQLAQGVEHFGLHQLRRVEVLLLASEQRARQRVERLSTAEQEVGQRGCVEDDHRPSRPSRTTSALDGPVYGARSEIR